MIAPVLPYTRFSWRERWSLLLSMALFSLGIVGAVYGPDALTRGAILVACWAWIPPTAIPLNTWWVYQGNGHRLWVNSGMSPVLVWLVPRYGAAAITALAGIPPAQERFTESRAGAVAAVREFAAVYRMVSTDPYTHDGAERSTVLHHIAVHGLGLPGDALDRLARSKIDSRNAVRILHLHVAGAAPEVTLAVLDHYLPRITADTGGGADLWKSIDATAPPVWRAWNTVQQGSCPRWKDGEGISLPEWRLVPDHVYATCAELPPAFARDALTAVARTYRKEETPC